MSDSTIERLCKSLSADGMMKDLGEFARRIKLSGTPEELESFRFIQKRLDEYGYRTAMISHEAYISLPGRAELSIGNDRITCITHSFSRPSAPAGTRGQLVHVGHGSAADFAGADVRGKVALIDGIANPAASLRASQAGAIGQVHVSPHEHKHEMCISPVWGNPTPETIDRLPSTVVVSIAQADGEGLKRRLANGERITATLQAEVDTGWRDTPILVAEMSSPNGGPDEPFVLFTGHHDTWYYGVMDNGSANATMIELARICAANRDQWRRGLRICFWSGHSHGRYSGSAWYADEHWHELERRCVANVNIDSTGGKGATVLTDVLTSSELRGLGREAVRVQGEQELLGLRMSRAGDQSFWGVGVPSMFMGMGEQPAAGGMDVAASILGNASGRKGAGFGWWWHTPDDTIDKIDPELLVRDARIYVHTLWHLLHDRVVRLDYAQWAQDFLAELGKLKGALGGRFDIAPLVSRAEALRAKAASLGERARTATGDAECAALNAALMRVSRALVPIDYTSGDRFGHDPALGQSAWPPLDPIRRLAGAKADSDDAKFIAVSATRARNRVAHALDEAIAAADAGLAGA
jgi:hypothetical protein